MNDIPARVERCAPGQLFFRHAKKLEGLGVPPQDFYGGSVNHDADLEIFEESILFAFQRRDGPL